MFDFYEKRKIRSWLYSKPVAAVLFALLVLLSISVYERFKIERSIAQKRAETEAELRTLTERRDAMKADVEHLNSDRGVEEELRSRFDVAKTGEQVVVIMNEDAAEDGGDAAASTTPDRQPAFWLWRILKFW
jgi:cell division protein FtsB